MYRNSYRFKRANYAKKLKWASILNYFLYYSLVKYIENTLLPKMNKEIEGKLLTLNELLPFISIIFFTSLYINYN